MRIALLTDGIYPYVLGGMQKHSYYLAKYLARNKVHVDLYHTGNSDADTSVLRGFSDEELSFIIPYYVPFPSVSKLPGHYILESYLYSKKLYEAFKNNSGIDVIYAQGLTGWYFIKEKHRGKKAIPDLLVNLHGLNMYQYQATLKARMESSALKFATDFILKNADHVISLGGQLTDILRNLGIDNKRIIEQPVAIEKSWVVQKIKNTLTVRSFVFVGRYDKVKGTDQLDEVLKKLKGLTYVFHFIGPFPDSVQLKQDNIIYHGLIKDESEIKRILQSSDILVCPSYSEGMPTVILEAMASGLAVLATDVGAVGLLVQEETGWLIPVGNKEALSVAFIQAITCEETVLNSKKVNARNLIKGKYTWDKVITFTLNQITVIAP